MNRGTNKLFEVIRNCYEFLSWLHSEEKVTLKELPEKFKSDCKKMQDLGIVYRRNNMSLGIRFQRLRQLISKNGQEIPYNPDLLMGYFAEPSLTS